MLVLRGSRRLLRIGVLMLLCNGIRRDKGE
jgi:hypothetical protein